MKGKYYERFFNPMNASATPVGQGRDRRKVKGIVVWESYPASRRYGPNINKGTYIREKHGELPSIWAARAKAEARAKASKKKDKMTRSK